MAKMEVLAHITAPSDFKDDTRYRAQAAVVAEFEPGSRVAVYHWTEDTRQILKEAGLGPVLSEESSFHSSLSFSAWRGADIVRETPAQKQTGRLLSERKGTASTARTTKTRRNASEATKAPDRPIPWRITKSSTANSNPPFKTPSLYAKLGGSTILAARTPEVPRLKTAPTSAFASQPKESRGRARSESSSFESLRSVVPDSQERQSTVESEASCSTLVQPVNLGSKRRRSESGEAISLPIARLQRPPTKRTKTIPLGSAPATGRVDRVASLRSGNHCQTSAGRRQTEQATGRCQKSQTPNLVSLWCGTKLVLSAPKPPRRVSHDSTGRATTSSDSTEMWPPPTPPKQNFPPPPKPDSSIPAGKTAYDSIPAPPAGVDADEAWQFPSSSPGPALPEAPPAQEPLRPPCGPSLEAASADSPFMAISARPSSINAPSPPVGHAQYTTHLTSPLRLIASRLPIVTNFRPTLVTRDIKVLERGYWYIPITILSNPATAGEDGKDRPDGKLVDKKDRRWTEEAFLQFWDAFAEFIQNGNAGWGVALYREDPSRGVHAVGEGMQVVLKVTCWAETLAHVYLVMWVLSGKRIGVAECLEWRDGGEDVVVRLGGPGFGYKGGEGADGRWGILDRER
jgi:hypothetical protein